MGDMGDMEWYYSIARDARWYDRPWRKPLSKLMGILRGICWYWHQVTFWLFLKGSVQETDRLPV